MLQSPRDSSSSAVELETYHDEDPMLADNHASHSPMDSVKDRLPFFNTKRNANDETRFDWKSPIFYIFIGLFVGYLLIPNSNPVASEPERHKASIPDSESPTIEVPRPLPLPVYPHDRKPDVAVNKACESLPELLIDEQLSQVEKASVSVVVNGMLIDTHQQDLHTGDNLCILVAIPQNNFEDESLYLDPPASLRGPDSIHLYLNSSNAILTIPPLRAHPSNQSDWVLLHVPHAIVYSTAITLNQAGDYQIISENEYGNWRWEQEYHSNMGTLMPPNPLIGTFPSSGDFPWDYKPVPLPTVPITVQGTDHFSRKPTCDATLTAAQGRWLRAASFPHYAHVPPALVDEWGYTWQGDHCDLDYFSPHEAASCLAHKRIHFYGDSNGRRLLKVLLAGGRWCLDPTASCQDEDDRADTPITTIQVDELGHLNSTTIPRENHFQGLGDRPDPAGIAFGRNTTAYFTFLTKLTNDTSHWMDRLYDAADLEVHALNDTARIYADREVRPGAVPRQPPGLPAADIAILVPGSWDAAFAERFNAYQWRVEQLRDAFLGAYARATTVLRLSHQYCCRAPSNYRRFNGQRLAEFDDRLRAVFAVEGGTAAGGAMRVLDPGAMSGRPEVLETYGQSRANHPRASHVRMEWAMLMNSLCERDAATGSVRFREVVD